MATRKRATGTGAKRATGGRKSKKAAGGAQSLGSDNGGQDADGGGALSLGSGGDDMSGGLQNILNLNSQMIDKFKDAKSALSELGGKLSAVGLGMKGLGIPTSAGEVLQFAVNATEQFNKLQEANTKVQDSLTKTGGAAGLSLNNVEGAAKELSDKVKNSRTEITEMMATMLTYPGVTKANFSQASEAAVDMATVMHTSVNGAAAQIGAALKDPLHGIQELNKSGAHVSAETQQQVQKLVGEGKSAAAQQLILNSLTNEFGGAATKAFNSDPVAMMHKLMENLSLGIGGVISNLITKLTPAFTAIKKVFDETIKSAFDWVMQHQEIVKGAVIIIASVLATTLAPAAWTSAVSFVAGLIPAIIGAASATWAFTAALLANPLTWIGLAIGAVIVTLYELYTKFASVRGIVWAVWAVIKEFGSLIKDLFTGIGHVIHGAFTFNLSEIEEGLSGVTDTLSNASDRIVNAAKKGYDEGVADFNKDKKDEAGQKQGGALPATAIPVAGADTGTGTGTSKATTGGGIVKPGTGGAAANTSTTPPPAPAAASGNKVVNVIINIGKLIERFEIKTTNITDSAGKIEELVANALLKATNDASLYTET